MASSETILEVPGIRLAAVSAGIKTEGRLDLVLFELAQGSAVAATFTRNAFCAAPVTVAREHLSSVAPRYLLVNTGNANAGTGDRGIEDARRCCSTLAQLVGVESERVLPFSTGVIGEHLPVERMEAVFSQALDTLDATSWADAAKGILTTDTRPKLASRHTGGFALVGIAKGSGMIRPNMATMLAYVCTDAAIEPAFLRETWNTVVENSFNRVSVDGDTSTNDAAILVATGAAGNEVISNASHPDFPAFLEALQSLSLELAQALVRDGEGASKFVEVNVQGGRNEEECLQVAYTVAHSPLVKTALFASDPNWGRLLMAIGRAGVNDLDVGEISVLINGVLIAEGGCRAPEYTEEQGVEAMRPEDILIEIRLGRGDSDTSVWTSDLSYDYVKINAEYRT